MKVHLRQIPEGSTLFLEGEEDAAFLGLDEAGAGAASPLRYALSVGLSDGGLFAAGNLSIRVRMSCVACLEPFEQEIVLDPFAMQKELDGRETVDLSPEIREDIHLALPTYPRCDSGEPGRICPARFPATAEGHRERSSSDAWQALDKLNTND